SSLLARVRAQQFGLRWSRLGWFRSEWSWRESSRLEWFRAQRFGLRWSGLGWFRSEWSWAQ
ncbi:hypothetical protein ACFW9V_37780, partial [Streptomyces hygroscopicus]|uniref:hypothetical protein n=1 Tax=Streptomyces hygroscopicus TaxID=1912 RepID=UPI003689599C